jgi:hypothetical protein
MADTSEASEPKTSSMESDLLRGAGAIAIVLYGEDTPSTRRRLYHEQNNWPLFRLANDGVLYALKSRLHAFLAAKSAEREAAIAANAALAEAEAGQPKLHRRRRQRARGQRHGSQVAAAE